MSWTLWLRLLRVENGGGVADANCTYERTNREEEAG